MPGTISRSPSISSSCPRLAERLEVRREIARRRPLVRVRRPLILAALHHVPRVRKRRRDRDRPDVLVVLPPAWSKCRWLLITSTTSSGATPSCAQTVLETRRPRRAGVLDAVDVVEFRRFLVPRPGVDEHGADLVLDQQAAHAELNSVSSRRRRSGAPTASWARRRTSRRRRASGRRPGWRGCATGRAAVTRRADARLMRDASS